MIRQLTHLAVLAVSLTAMATPAHARDDFMDKIMAENGLEGCTRATFTTAWNCTGKTGSTGAKAGYQATSSDDDDTDDIYLQRRNRNRTHDRSAHTHEEHWENPRNHWKNDQPNR